VAAHIVLRARRKLHARQPFYGPVLKSFCNTGTGYLASPIKWAVTNDDVRRGAVPKGNSLPGSQVSCLR